MAVPSRREAAPALPTAARIAEFVGPIVAIAADEAATQRRGDVPLASGGAAFPQTPAWSRARKKRRLRFARRGVASGRGDELIQGRKPWRSVLYVQAQIGIVLGGRLGAFARGDGLRSLIDDIARAMFGVISIVMRAAPLGAFGAVAYTIALNGLAAIVIATSEGELDRAKLNQALIDGPATAELVVAA